MVRPEWFIATASTASALLALALALGVKEWVFRPRITLRLRHPARPDEISDRIVTKRIDTAETAAFVRLRLDNRGRSTARRVGVRVLQIHLWDRRRLAWVRARPELDGRLLWPSNQLPGDANTVEVFRYSDRIVDLVSVTYGSSDNRLRPAFVEIGRPWPPNEANLLDPGVWELELLVCGDNIRARRYFVKVSFDGVWPEPEGPGIWDHLLVEGPSLHVVPGPGAVAPSATAGGNR
ncbi:hypothetical protein ABIA33_003003 [Streptacidiphilus sp. MAP12-16]|uniref:hypothetical protein n=1 Tax=Streptacidiphilus sp. MAP12-16 TaxID=3156300 RepID=UPI003519168B